MFTYLLVVHFVFGGEVWQIGDLYKAAQCSGRRELGHLSKPDTFSGPCEIAGLAGKCACYDVNRWFVGTPNEGAFDGQMSCHVLSSSGWPPDINGEKMTDPFGKDKGGEICPVTGQPGAPKGRRLGHNTFQTDCSQCAGTCAAPQFYKPCTNLTPKQQSKFFTTQAHHVYGRKAPFSLEGRAMLVDCITYQCAPLTRRLSEDIHVEHYRRQLGHGGGGGPTVPPGWLPDLKRKPGFSNKDFCDMRTMVSPDTISSEPWFAVITYGWFINCCVLSKSTVALTRISDVGFKGIMYLVPCASEGCSVVQYTSISTKLFDENPIPDIPVCVSAQGSAAFGFPKGFAPNPTGRPDDEDALENYMMNAAQQPFTMEVHVVCSSDPSPYYEANASAGNVAVHRIWGVIYALLIIFSMYTLKKMQAGGLRWSTYVVAVEGVVGSSVRCFRAMTGPYYFNGEGATTPFDWGNWIGMTAEQPYTMSTTWVTSVIWLKLVSGRSFSGSFKVVLDVITATGVVFVIVFNQVFGFFWPWQPWVGNPFSGANASTELYQFTTIPPIVMNAFLVVLFAFGSVGALVKVSNISKEVGNKTVDHAVKRMSFFVALQASGLILTMTGAAYMVDSRWNAMESQPLVYTIFITSHLREIGNILTSWSQVLAVSSSSSSSSSSTANSVSGGTNLQTMKTSSESKSSSSPVSV